MQLCGSKAEHLSRLTVHNSTLKCADWYRLFAVSLLAVPVAIMIVKEKHR